MSLLSPSDIVRLVLQRRQPPRFVFAPNYWQWFAHHRNHGRLPPEIAHCRSQLEVINHLGLDVFSRNLYCDEQRAWFGGLADEVWNGLEVRVSDCREGRDRVITKTYHTPRGVLSERRRYVFNESTLVQEKFLLDDPATQLDAVAALIAGRRWRFCLERYAKIQQAVGDRGIVIAGELCSPLKLLHLLAGPVNTTFLLQDHPERLAALMAIHEQAQLDLVRQMAQASVPAMMAMDNLDTAFHPPRYVEQYAASFYERASRRCHEHGALFLIHACGWQKGNLRLVDSYGVDGLEGVAFPPLGDVELTDALAMTSDRFLISGGISAMETSRLKTRAEVFQYVRQLFSRLRPYARRFMLGASCNTAIDTRWDTIKHFRDAWLECGGL